MQRESMSGQGGITMCGAHLTLQKALHPAGPVGEEPERFVLAGTFLLNGVLQLRRKGECESQELSSSDFSLRNSWAAHTCFTAAWIPSTPSNIASEMPVRLVVSAEMLPSVGLTRTCDRIFFQSQISVQ